jgi:hypothetical protein
MQAADPDARAALRKAMPYGAPRSESHSKPHVLRRHLYSIGALGTFRKLTCSLRRGRRVRVAAWALARAGVQARRHARRPQRGGGGRGGGPEARARGGRRARREAPDPLQLRPGFRQPPPAGRRRERPADAEQPAAAGRPSDARVARPVRARPGGRLSARGVLHGTSCLFVSGPGIHANDAKRWVDWLLRRAGWLMRMT